jgi:hypothetical protein
MTIVVTWMDAKQETYRCKEWRCEDGLLWLTPYPGGLTHQEPLRCIPLAGVRIWTVD